MEELKAGMLKLLREDEEFRYAVAGLIGLEEILKRFDRHEAELVKLREDMNKLREDMNQGFKRYDEELVGLRDDMNKGFELVNRHISALGARWGLLAEESFRSGIKGLVEKYFGGKVERWAHYDEDGIVFGYPSVVEVDLIIKDKEHILVEIKSSTQKQTYLNYGRLDNSTKNSGL